MDRLGLNRRTPDRPRRDRLTAALWLGGALSLPGCIIDHELGETAESTGAESSSDDAETTANPDPSATGMVPDDSSGSSGGAEVTTDPTATGGEETTDGTGGEVDCSLGEDWVVWQDDFFDPLPGISASFAAVLSGPCSLDSESSMTPGPGQAVQWVGTFDCTLSGRIDGDANVQDQSFSPQVRISSSASASDWVPFLEGPLQMRVVLDFWGMGWSRYLVIEQDGAALIDLVDGEYTDPLDGVSWIEDIETLLGGDPWHGDLGMAIVPDQCGLGPMDKCGGDARGVEFTWPNGPALTLHGSQGAQYDTAASKLEYGLWVEAAADLSRAVCTDMPLGDYRVTAWRTAP